MKSIYNNLSLKARIVGFISLLVIFISLFVYIYFPYVQNRVAVANLQREAENLTEVLSYSLVAAVEFEDVMTIESILAGIRLREDLLGIEVYNAGQTLLFSFYNDNHNSWNTILTEHERGRAFSVEKAVISFEEEIGALRVALSLESLRIQETANRRAVILVSLIIIAIGGLIGYYISMIVLKPIKQINEILTEFAEGEGNLTRRINIDMKGEIGYFAEMFNKFLGNLAGLIEQVQSSSDRVMEVVQHIIAISTQSANGAETQTAQTQQVAASVQEMTAAILQNSKHAGQTAQIAESATSQAQEGSQAMSVTGKGMDEIVATTVKTGALISTLSERADTVGEIIQVIDDIADQTNLLALNAAIEAARAGEQGRGFSVVADEVRKLAERTMKATSEIAETIKSIQDGAQNAAAFTKEAEQVVNKGKESTARTEQVLANIVSSVTQAMDMISQIATATEEMSSGAEEISKNVETINSIAVESASGADQMAQVAERLNQETEVLRKLMSRFHL